MAVSSLKRVLTSGFISGIDKLGSKENEGSKVLKSLQGGGSKVDLGTSLRTGARNFAVGVQALNVGIAYLQVSKGAHEKLISIVDRLDLVVAKAAKGGYGAQSGRYLEAEFQELARDFRKQSREAKINEDDALDIDDLKGALTRAGLDSTVSEDLGAAFKRIVPLNKSSTDAATGEVTSVSTQIPVTDFSAAIHSAVAASENPDENPSGFFESTRRALKSLRNRLESNERGLDEAIEVVGKNMDLVRAAGFAFLDLSEQINSAESAESIAQELREKIRRDAPGALSQAENLQPILVAGLTLAGKQEEK